MATTVNRLRIAARHDHSQGRMMNDAADLIEQQQREIGALEAHLGRIVELVEHDSIKGVVLDTAKIAPQATLAEVRARAVEGFANYLLENHVRIAGHSGPSGAFRIVEAEYIEKERDCQASKIRNNGRDGSQ